MARRSVTAVEERELIAAAEAARDAGILGPRADIRIAPDASAVLSVRLPIGQLRKLRAVAIERGVSVSALLQEAVMQLLTKQEPTVTATEQLRRLWITGMAIAEPDTQSNFTVSLESPGPVTGHSPH